MAKFGQSFIQSLTQPGYSQGMFNLGATLGQAPAMAAEKKAKQGMQKDLKEALISNDASVIEAKGAAILEKQPELGAKLIARARGLRTKEQEARTSKGLQGGLAAIQAAATRGVPLADLKEAQKSVISLGGTREQIASAYKAGVPEAKESPALDITESTILVDGVLTVVQTATDTETGKIVSQNTIGTAESTGGKGDKKGLTALFADAGVEVDLDTADGIRTARNFALTDMSSASLAGLLDDMLLRKLPMNASESIKFVRDSDPAFAINEELVEKAGRFKVLSKLGKDDVAGVAALIERTVTSTTENDLRAVAELDRFRGSKDIKQSLVDWGTMLASGKLSEDTLLEYTRIMTGLERLAKNRISDSIDRLSVAAVTEKEQEALNTARKYFGVSDDVEIL
jgi:hypothetical protein